MVGLRAFEAPRFSVWRFQNVSKGFGGSFLLTVGVFLLTVKFFCLQSLEALVRRTFPL